MKAAIYLRVSSLEQNPENQESECLAFAKRVGYEIEGIYREQLSGFKDIHRPKYEIIKQKASRREIQAVIVWALDRWVRNRDTQLEDITILSNMGVKLHSVKEAWIEAINIDGALGRTIRDFCLGLIGSLAEMESQRKSERMKIAFANRKGRWGRKELPDQVQDQILESWKLGKSIRQISKEVTYWDRNNNKKLVSLGAVHKIILNFRMKNPSFVHIPIVAQKMNTHNKGGNQNYGISRNRAEHLET